MFASSLAVGGRDKPLFHFGCRSVEHDAVPHIREALKGRDGIGSLYLTGSGVFRFCPWCGVELREFYRDTWRELVDQKVLDEFGTAA